MYGYAALLQIMLFCLNGATLSSITQMQPTHPFQTAESSAKNFEEGLLRLCYSYGGQQPQCIILIKAEQDRKMQYLNRWCVSCTQLLQLVRAAEG